MTVLCFTFAKAARGLNSPVGRTFGTQKPKRVSGEDRNGTDVSRLSVSETDVSRLSVMGPV